MPDKHLVSLFIASTFLLFFIAFLVVASIIHFRNQLNKHFLERQNLLIANQDEAERVMNHVAKEVHDNIGQIAHLLFNIIRRAEKTGNDNERKDLFQQAKRLTDIIINNTDNISHTLNSDYIKEKGLSNVIQTDVEHIRAAGNINCNFNYKGEIVSFDPAVELVIYRIAQEAMRNVLRHSQATWMTIFLHYEKRGFTMDITDNGVGMRVRAIKSKGLGLNSMFERAKSLKAKLDIYSSPGFGCAVSLFVPNVLRS